MGWNFVLKHGVAWVRCIAIGAGLAEEKAVSRYKFCIVTEAARLVREVCRNTR